MKRGIIWTISIMITISAALYQRITGPTYPDIHKLTIKNEKLRIKLPRSQGGDNDKRIRIPSISTDISGELVYRRFPTNESWDTIVMHREENWLTGYLPAQPPAGKLEYFLILNTGTEEIRVNTQPVIIRFKGSVPAWALIPHILFIFTAMFFSTVTGFFAIYKHPSYKKLGWYTLILLVTGGLVLGPIIQYYAFGDFWTGYPFGKDLTDNKILFAFFFWFIATFGNIRKERPYLAWLAAGIYLIINLIPHSLFGSELNYETGKVLTGFISFPVLSF